MNTYSISQGFNGLSYLVKTINSNPNSYEHRKQILEPMCSMIRLALLSFKDDGTKISICNNKINYQSYNIIQGPLRWSNGDKRSDLHNLCEPIQKALKWYDLNDKHILFIFKIAIDGLMKLKNTYKNNDDDDSNLVTHSLSYYINIIQSEIDELEDLDDDVYDNISDDTLRNSNNNDNNSSNSCGNISSNNANTCSNGNNIDDIQSTGDARDVIDRESSSKKKKKKKKKKHRDERTYDDNDNDNVNINSNNDNEHKQSTKVHMNRSNNIQISSSVDIKKKYESDRIRDREYSRDDIHQQYRNDGLSNIWDDREIKIIYDILLLINEKYSLKQKYIYLLDTIECILEEKDINVQMIIQKLSTSLKD